jgi:large subunit ribosomal protein L25
VKVNEKILVVEQREAKGTSVSRRMRKSGLLPGIIYNEKGESQLIQLNSHNFAMMLRRHASANMMLDLQIGDHAAKRVLLKDVQREVIGGHVIHVDFQEVSMTRKMRVHIPIRLVGDPVGVAQGGILDQRLRELEVECLPSDLVEEITVDVSALGMGQTIIVSQIQVSPKLRVMNSPILSVASVMVPIVEEEVKAEVAADSTEPELIKKPEKESEGEGGKDAKSEPKDAKGKKEEKKG